MPCARHGTQYCRLLPFIYSKARFAGCQLKYVKEGGCCPLNIQSRFSSRTNLKSSVSLIRRFKRSGFATCLTVKKRRNSRIPGVGRCNGRNDVYVCCWSGEGVEGKLVRSLCRSLRHQTPCQATSNSAAHTSVKISATPAFTMLFCKGEKLAE